MSYARSDVCLQQPCYIVIDIPRHVQEIFSVYKIAMTTFGFCHVITYVRADIICDVTAWR